MADMKQAVLATVLLSLILMGELQRCSGQVHYKNPGWGPGGKRSSNMAKRQSSENSPTFEVDSTEQHRQLAMLHKIARSLAKKFLQPTSSDKDTAWNPLQRAVNKWENEEDDSHWI